MAEEKRVIGTAVASPTKQFFVNMLTRDIELQDAILDLLDNCVDGILRSQKIDSAAPGPYDGFEAPPPIARRSRAVRPPLSAP